MQRALSATLHEVYFLVVGAAVLVFVLALLFPRGSAASLAVGSSSDKREEPQEDEKTPPAEGRLASDERSSGALS